ncbi:hypothetical protein [Falsiroseomonas tokyonensis]|uniref:Uncharacterized protein n=1 Tax=Falsiroseomonas tokyonensis TaxID=430521 RepID=A0ABV7BT84_9PROT|nr:hypothetical protein [Falsiroseomonas tokyonensis]MBU8537861.1 hypothetical protein [Falsiroseomonas tokyonensis]
MSATPHPATRLLQRMAFGLLVGGSLAAAGRATAAAPAGRIRLFQVVTIRDDLLLGLTPAELAALGPGPDVERLARSIAQHGQLSGWLYRSQRGPDGTSRLVPAARISVSRQEALTLRPYAPLIPVQAP